MTIEELLKKYALCDGLLLSFGFEYHSGIFNVKVRIRKCIAKNKYEKITATLEFKGVKELDLYEDFPTNGGWTNITLARLDNSEIYLSFDPYDNTGLPHERDNWTIKAKSLHFINEEGVKEEIAG